MQNSWMVDQDGTYGAVKNSLISSAPKVKFGSDTGEQATTRDQIPQWVLQVLQQYKNDFGAEVAEVLKLTIASETDPGKDIPDMASVDIEGLTVGVMEGRDGQGYSIYYRAKTIRPAASAGPSNPKATATVKANDASKAA